MKTALKQIPSVLFLILLFGLAACMLSKDKLSGNKMLTDQFDWQGHRGARGLAPENTIPAFLKALEFPRITTLEMDLAISADGQVLVSHEPWMSAAICTTPDGLPVKAEDEENFLLFVMPYAQIAQFDCGKRGNSRFPEQQAMPANKPLLKDVVQSVNHYCSKNQLKRPHYNIEIKSQPNWDGKKSPPPAQFATIVLREIEELGISKQVCIQSFDPRVLREVKAISPKTVTALLVENLKSFDTNIQELGYTPEIYSPYYKLLSAEVVQKAHVLKMKVIPWTVNEPEEMRKLMAMGVDGIITDYPNRIPPQ